jgi:hypothetical protein
MRLYCVVALHESNYIEGGAIVGQAEIAISWAPGMVGALPVFKDLESAKSYSGDIHDIMEIEFPERVTS